MLRDRSRWQGRSLTPELRSRVFSAGTVAEIVIEFKNHQLMASCGADMRGIHHLWTSPTVSASEGDIQPISEARDARHAGTAFDALGATGGAVWVV